MRTTTGRVMLTAAALLTLAGCRVEEDSSLIHYRESDVYLPPPPASMTSSPLGARNDSLAPPSSVMPAGTQVRTDGLPAALGAPGSLLGIGPFGTAPTIVAPAPNMGLSPAMPQGSGPGAALGGTFTDLAELSTIGEASQLPGVDPRADVEQRVQELLQVAQRGTEQQLAAGLQRAQELAAARPEDPRPYLALLMIYIRKGQYAKAIPAADMCENLGLKTKDVYLLRGRARLGIAARSLAIEDFERVLALDATSIEAVLLRAQTLLEQEDYEGAIRDAGRAIELGYRAPEAYFLRARAMIESGQYDRVVPEMNALLQLDPSNGEAHLGLAVAHYHLREFQRAVDDATLALRLRMQAPQVYFVRALSYMGLGERALAQTDLDEAARRGLDEGSVQLGRRLLSSMPVAPAPSATGS